jgi:hypothetical protein
MLCFIYYQKKPKIHRTFFLGGGEEGEEGMEEILNIHCEKNKDYREI